MKIPRILITPRMFLPAIIFVGVLIMGMRINDIWDAATSGKMYTRPAMAETETKSEEHKAEEPKTETKTEAKPEGDKATTEAGKGEAPTITPPTVRLPPDDGEVSPAEMEVLKQLSDRRTQLDKRSKDLDARETLIKVTESRVEQKIQDMEKLRIQLQSMVSQASEAQAVQIDNLVKIYETMKPEEAARIFETLDMKILLGVIQRMKPARTAPIMAKMAPEKAKDITTALTQQDRLPEIK